MSDSEHERRIADLERSRTEQWEKINAMYAMVKVLYDRADRAPTLPCLEHKERIDKLEESHKQRIDKIEDDHNARLAKLESTGNRFGGAWDFAKIAFGSAIPVVIFFLGKLL